MTNADVEIEFVRSTLIVSIEFDATPAEPMVRYYQDGSGYPGCPSTCDFCRAAVVSFSFDGECTSRKDSAIWMALDELAEALIIERWDSEFRQKCIDDITARSERTSE